MAEMMAALAAGASSEAEAEAMIGAATVTTLSARDRAELRRLLPHLVRASCVLTRILRRNRRTRPVVAAVPTIIQRTARDLTRRASAGRPVNRRVAARSISRQTRGVLGSPRRTAAALQRNARATSAMRRSAGSRGRGYAPASAPACAPPPRLRLPLTPARQERTRRHDCEHHAHSALPEFEEELEGEYEGEEFDLGGVISGLLGEGESEDELEGENTSWKASGRASTKTRASGWRIRSAACTRTR